MEEEKLTKNQQAAREMTSEELEEMMKQNFGDRYKGRISIKKLLPYLNKQK